MPTIRIDELPTDISLDAATALCYGSDIADITDALCSYQSVLVECDKLLMPYLLRSLRTHLRSASSSAPRMSIVDHRQDEGEGAVGATLKAFRGAVSDLTEKVDDGEGQDSVLVIPNFDVMVTGDQSGQHVDMTAREVMVVMYENPDLRVLAFKDPNLSIPKSVAEFFSRRVEVFGIDRVHLPQLITQEEARRLDTQVFEPYRLYKHVSGLNVVKLRQLLQGFRSQRYVDGQPEPVLRELRKATVGVAEAELPHVPFDDIGGYSEVKRLIQENVLGLLQSIEERSSDLSEEEIRRLERLVPKNILFTGPPGTGKTLFCKALATELNATIIIVNGPELKSKWVGEAEERVRKIFTRARRCSPALIVFDEIDSFGGKRAGKAAEGGTAQGMGSSSDHSMLNQLLTEMDGFHDHESVFVIATTNFASSLDDALRARFRYEVEIGYPNRTDREAIIGLYDDKYDLRLSPDVVSQLLDDTECWIDQSSWSRFAGRELESLASSLGRAKLLSSLNRQISSDDVQVTGQMAKAAVDEKVRSRSPEIDFVDIGGYREVKDRLEEEILDMLLIARDLPLAKRKEVENMIPKGVIFEGPPGTGKTMFAKALANALGATISIVSGPEMKSMWHGESERQVREIFAQARRNAPSVIVFDEIDSIAGDRGGASMGVDRSMVNQLLTEMDGFGDNELVFVVATTNFAQSLDSALRRPGRFEYVLSVPYPDEDARRAILRLYNDKYQLGLDDKGIDHLVFRTDGWVDIKTGTKYSGDHIEAVCRGISRKKLRDSSFETTFDNLDQIVAQRTKKPVDVTPEEENVIAVHEAGHATVSLNLEGSAPIKKISIASEYDGSLGYVLHGESAQKYIQDESQLRAQIVCLMGGRVAEREILGHIASGSANDLETATLIATHLVTVFGMDDEIGPRMILHPLIHGEKANGATSPELLARVEVRVAAILLDSENAARECIRQHREDYDALVSELLEKKIVEFREEKES